MDRNSDFFRHVDKQTIKPVHGKITGTLPKWLEGVMIRNGPGIQEIGPDRYNHLFDGLAVIHRFEIKNGQVTYQNRALESDTLKKNTSVQRIVVNEFGTHGVTDPCKSLFDRFKSTFLRNSPDTDTTTDNCNVNVAFYGDQLYAMTETHFVRRVDPETLETTGPKTRISDHIAVNHATAHPHILEDGTVMNMGNNYKHKKGPHYCIIEVPPSYDSDETSFKSAKIIAEIPMRWKMYPCYYHSFGMTSDKIVFVEQPYCLSLPKILTADIFGRSIRECFAWYSNYKTRIYIVPRNTGKAETLVYETDNLFTFHHINAYEEDGNVILDVAAYDDANFVNTIVEDNKTISAADSFKGASPRRYVLPTKLPENVKPGEDLINIKNCDAKAKLRAGSDGKIIDCVPHKFSNHWFEFPRINYKYNGKQYNFFYGSEASPERHHLSALAEPDIISKYDINTGKSVRWIGEGILASEPIFVPNPTPNIPAEDDGVILSGLLHLDDPNAASLLVLNAKDMKELARVKFNTVGPVSSTFHGLWAQSGEKVHTY